MVNKPKYAFASVGMDGNYSYIQEGLTKREYFAAMAMQGMLGQSGIHHKTMMQISSDAVRLADHLLNQLEKEEK